MKLVHRVTSLSRLVMAFTRPQVHRFVSMELTRFCNRRCIYCNVPDLYQPEQELSMQEAIGLVDRVANWGYCILSIVGGETLVPRRTREGIGIRDKTLRVIKHAVQRGLLTNLTTNGDFLNSIVIHQLASAGLSSMCLSLHTYTKEGVDVLLAKAQEVATAGIVPSISIVFTAPRSSTLAAVARYIISRGILVGVGLCQDFGGSFSSQCSDLVPSLDQQATVFEALLKLKGSGLLRTNKRYLQEAPAHYPNSWVCDPLHDEFLQIGADGMANVCSEVRTDIQLLQIDNLNDKQWRNTKAALVGSCRGCLHQCYYEAQNPDPFGDIPTCIAGYLIASGKHNLVKLWGKTWAKSVAATYRSVDWNCLPTSIG